MPDPSPDRLALASAIAAEYAVFPQVEAVTLAGSQTVGLAEPTSDLDMYVYLRAPLPLETRRRIATAHSQRAEVDNQYWEPGDEWIDERLGIGVDLMYRDPAWIEDQIERVLVRCLPSIGYTTCFWYNVLTSRILYDRAGWFAALQERCRVPYPEALRQAIIAKNTPLLRQTISSYAHQIERAVSRHDLVSVNHRVAAWLASYFDILFAINRLPHPGEKRLLPFALANCTALPPDLPAHIETLLRQTATGEPALLETLDKLADGLEKVIYT